MSSSESEIMSDNEEYEIKRSEIVEKCTGYTLKLTHPMIKEDSEYQILGFKEIDGKFNTFYVLYCFILEYNKYQRVFSNSYLAKKMTDCMPAWTSYDQDQEGIYIHHDKNRMFKFYPSEIKNYMGREYRKVHFEI